MTGAIGGQIKVTLTLDDAGFSVKTKQASSTIKGLNTDFRNVGKTAEGLETKLGTLGKNVSMSTQNLKLLQTGAKALAAQFVQAGESMQAFNSNSALASKNAELLNGVVLKLAGLLDKAAGETTKAAGASRQLASAQKDLSTSTASMVNGLTAQERAMRNLGAAHTAMAQKVVLAAGLQKNEVAKASAAEIDANNRVLATKQKNLAAMIKAERDYRNQLSNEQMKLNQLEQRAAVGRATNGRIVSKNSSAYQDILRETQAQRNKVAALTQAVALTDREGMAINAQIRDLTQANARLNTRIGLEERIEAALTRQKQRAAEYASQQASIALKEKQRLEDQRMQAEFMKEQFKTLQGMAQLYAGSKVWQGEKASVNAAGEFQRTGVRAKALGLSVDEKRQFDDMVKYDSENRRGVSYNDAATARLALMGGYATTDQKLVNSQIGQAMDAAQNIQFLSGDKSHEGFENLIRNLSGVVEARQQQYSPEDANRTFELVQKIVAATGGKLDIADIETYLRRIGMANAANMSDQGLINSVAFMDQAKVSGGGGGAGGGGVSTVGTMVKMLQAYATGKTMSNEMVSQAAEAGILNQDALTTDKGFKGLMKSAKKAGFENSQQFVTDPIGAIEAMMAKVLGTISNEKNRKKYFGDADVNDPEAQRAALTLWGNRNGMTTTATSLLVSAADPRNQERVGKTRDLIGKAPGVEELKQMRMDTYQQQVANFNASLENLKVTMGTTILPLVTKLFDSFSQFIDKVTGWANSNPEAAKFTMIGGAVLGVVTAISGLAKVFGVVGGLTSLFGMFGSKTAEAGAKAATSTGLWARLAAGVSALGGPMTAAMGYVTRLVAALGAPITAAVSSFVARFGGIGTATATASKGIASVIPWVTKMGGSLLGMLPTVSSWAAGIVAAISVVGKAFLRAIPFVGWLYTAWEFGSLLMSVKVGFTSIGEYIGHWITQTLLKIEGLGIKMRNVFRFGAESNAEGDAKAKANEDAQKADEEYFANLVKSNEKVAAEQEKARKEKEQKDKAQAEKEKRDLDNFRKGVGYEHKTKPAAMNTSGDNVLEMPTPPEKKAREPRDQFVRSLAQVSSKQEVTAMQIAAEVTGKANDLLEQAKTEFFEKWRAGDFDPNHDAGQRPFKSGDGSLNWNGKGADGLGVQDWLAARTAMLQQEEQLKALKYANERITAAQTDANAAMERGATDTSEQTREMGALQRELARTEVRLRQGTKDFEAWNAKKSEALFNRGRADLVNFTADFQDGDRQTQAGMVYNSKERIGAQFDQKAQKDLEQYNRLLKTMTDEYNASILGVNNLGLNEADSLAKRAELTQQFEDARTRAETQFTEHVKVQSEARAYAMRGALAKQEQEWQNAFDRMDEVSAQWGSSFLSNLSTVLTGGSVNWKNFVASMLKDVLDMNLKSAFGTQINGVFGDLGNTIKNLITGGATKPGQPGQAGGGVMSTITSVGGQMMTGAGNMLSGAGNMLKGGANSMLKMFGFDGIGDSAKAATGALTNMTQDGVTQATAGLVTQVAQQAVGTATDMTATAAMTTLTTSALSAATALAQVAFTQTATAAFANGGIMTSSGSVPLKAYANGGIANTPQLALFGEGRMNEAYVPLPDGRTIPVTFTGGGQQGAAGAGMVQQSVVISIVVNNDGTESSSGDDSSSDNESYGQLASKVKALVREELLTQKRSGGILNSKS